MITQGDWFVGGRNDWQVHVKPNGQPPVVVAECGDGRGTPESTSECRANALLIAASPGLAEFVERWRNIICGGDKPGTLEGWAKEFHDEATALLRKAGAV